MILVARRLISALTRASPQIGVTSCRPWVPGSRFARPGHARPSRLILASLLTVAAAPAAHADDPFYKNKRLTILINFAPGGPTDIEGRMFAKASRPPYRWRAEHRDPEHGRRRRHRRGQVYGRGGAARRQHRRLLHRHRLHVRARSRALPRRLQDLPVRRDPGRHDRAFRAHRRRARDEGGDRHRQCERPRRRRPERGHAQGPAAAARHGHAGHPVQIRHRLSLEPGGAARVPARRDQLSSRNRRRAIAAWSIRAW